MEQASIMAMGNGQNRIERHYRISELAALLGCSRGTIYNALRGEKVVHFAEPGRRGIMLIPESTLAKVLKKRERVYR